MSPERESSRYDRCHPTLEVDHRVLHRGEVQVEMVDIGIGEGNREDTISDLVADFLYYDRKEDEDLPRGEIEKAIKAEEITAHWIVLRFRQKLVEGLADE